MSTQQRTVGEYVTRTHPVTETGTFTGVPATRRGAYVTGSDGNRPLGSYTQSAQRRPAARTRSPQGRFTDPGW